MSLSRSIDQLAASMEARARAQEVFANNLANAATDGFVRQRVGFAQLLDAARGRQVSLVTQVDAAGGAIETTGRPADVALPGGALLVVQTPAGERYTRGGSLALNANGEIVDRAGHPVLGTGGPITPGSADFRVNEKGDIMVRGAAVGRLRVVATPPPGELRPEGGGLLAARSTPDDLESPQLLPGHLQTSNVDVVSEMVDMVESLRLYESSGRALRAYDEIMGRLVQTAQQAVR